MIKSLTLATLFVVTVALTAAASVQAQYPQPAGSVLSTASETFAEVGDTITLVCDAADVEGDPLSGASCTFRIASEPGNDAALGSKEITKTTNSEGQAFADLYVGTEPGVIVVVMSSGNVSGTVLVTVSEVAGARPPAGPIDDDDDGNGGITPPSTGNGGLAH